MISKIMFFVSWMLVGMFLTWSYNQSFIADINSWTSGSLDDLQNVSTCSTSNSGWWSGCAVQSNFGWSTSSQGSGVFVQGTMFKKSDFNGKPSFLWRAGKYCAYCREKIKPAESLLLQQFSGQINIQIFTMNFDTQKFDTSIPQVPFEVLNYQDYTQQTCDMFPTRVLLDAQGRLVNKECGGTGTIESVAEQIRILLP